MIDSLQFDLNCAIEIFKKEYDDETNSSTVIIARRKEDKMVEDERNQFMLKSIVSNECIFSDNGLAINEESIIIQTFEDISDQELSLQLRNLEIDPNTL